MKTLIICISIHRGNTEMIAKAIAEVLDAKLLKPREVNVSNVSEYDLIGFGSGIYFGEHHRSLLKMVDGLPDLKDKKVFIFSTSGASNVGNFLHNIRHRISHFHTPLREKLAKKGFDIIGEFSCRGFDTYVPFKLIGGINKGRPNKEDLGKAKNFARSLKDKNLL